MTRFHATAQADSIIQAPATAIVITSEIQLAETSMTKSEKPAALKTTACKRNSAFYNLALLAVREGHARIASALHFSKDAVAKIYCCSYIQCEYQPAFEIFNNKLQQLLLSRVSKSDELVQIERALSKIRKDFDPRVAISELLMLAHDGRTSEPANIRNLPCVTRFIADYSNKNKGMTGKLRYIKSIFSSEQRLLRSMELFADYLSAATKIRCPAERSQNCN